MGYYTHFTGQLTFSRPLTFEESKAITSDEEYPSFELAGDRHVKETELGRLEIITGVGIEPVSDDGMKAYDALDELLDLTCELPADVTISGEIRGEGEEAGDIRRYVPSVNGRSVVELKPKLVWADGHEEEGRR